MSFSCSRETSLRKYGNLLRQIIGVWFDYTHLPPDMTQLQSQIMTRFVQKKLDFQLSKSSYLFVKDGENLKWEVVKI